MQTKLLLFSSLLTVHLQAGTITGFSDRTAFTTAHGGTLTVEAFGPTAKFPISTGVLNSSTNLPGIGLLPGDIQPGVTYSTPVGTSFFFNIDSGGGYTGGFLDGFYGGDPDRQLTITFDNAQRGFGFDTNILMGSRFNLTINFLSGAPYVDSFSVSQTGMSFFGFLSDSADILSVVIQGRGHLTFAFALDNFTYAAGPSEDPIPEPSSIGLMALGLGAVVLRRRFRR